MPVPNEVELDERAVSSQLEVKETKKVLAVFVKQAVGPNAKLRYGGVRITARQKDMLTQHAKTTGNNFANYIASVDGSRYEDAHPRHQTKLANRYGGLSNEPSANEQANMLLVAEERNGRLELFYMTVDEIPAGTELMACYGNGYSRNYTTGSPALVPRWLAQGLTC